MKPQSPKRKAAPIAESRFEYWWAVGDRTPDKRIKSPLLYQLS